jgi:outer membrane protein assembly factor BamB
MFRQFFCTLTVVIVSTSTLIAADWTVFHGLQGDNKSPDTGLLKKWSSGGPKLLWTADTLGFGYSSVSVAGDRIFTNGNVGDLTMVFCLDNDGKEIWKKDNGPAHTADRTYPGTRSTPTVDGDVVYDASPLGQVTCYNATNGEKIWSKNLLQEYEAPMPRWILGHSIVVDGDTIICMVGGAKALAVALNKKTGAPVRVYANPAGFATAYATPYFFEFEGVRCLALLTGDTVEGYDAKTTKHLFTIPWKNMRTTNVTMPIYKDGHLFLSTGYGFGTKGFKLTKNADGTMKAEEQWYEQRFDNHHHGLVLVGDHVYGTTSGGNWCAVNFLTGEMGYSVRPVGEQGSVHFADGLIYVLSENSRTVILWEPNPKEFIERGRFVLPNEADRKSWAHPVVINGKLYLRHAQYLYCYDVKAE